jgi:hypothetical protein
LNAALDGEHDRLVLRLDAMEPGAAPELEIMGQG